MEKTVTAREANQNFSKLLREAENGRTLAITKRRRVVARLVPASEDGRRVLTPEQQRIADRMIRRMRRGWKLGIGKFNRDEIYDERIDRMKRFK
ncbi:MAG: type II toxin-antitoxin system Phd/YefM family antitoxin [Rhodospirillales bacterium]